MKSKVKPCGKSSSIWQNEVGPPPWTLEDSKEKFNQKVLPLLLHDNNHYRLYGIFLLNQLNGKEIFMTEEIWAILEEMTDYEKLYLTYLIQGLKLTKLDFIHRGLVELYKINNCNKIWNCLLVGLIPQKHLLQVKWIIMKWNAI